MSSYKYDERDTMFSRGELEPGTKQFEEYYKKNPEKKNAIILYVSASPV